MEPRTVIGTVSTSEFLVALGASAGFLAGLGSSAISYATVAALLAGGIVVAPFAAWLVRVLPMQVLGVFVGGLVVLTNARTLLLAAEAPGGLRSLAYGVVVTAWTAAISWAIARHRASAQRVESEPVPAGG